MATSKKKRPVGRPSSYSKKIGDAICNRLAVGDSLQKICREMGLDRQKVYGWMRSEPKFLDSYREARELQADTFHDQLVDIADTAVDRDSAAAAKVRVDTRKYVAARQAPRKYGDAPKTNLNIDLEAFSEEQLERVAKGEDPLTVLAGT